MPIFIVDDEKNNEINKLATKVLSNYMNVVFKKEKTFFKNNNLCKVNLRQKSKDSSLPIYIINPQKCDIILSGIIIFNSSSAQNYKIKIDENSICILESSNKYAIKLLSSSNATAITCGTSPKDTLSLASLTPGKAVISIQRKIFSLNNKIIESKDILIKLSNNYKTYSILSVCALINLLDLNCETHGEYIF